MATLTRSQREAEKLKGLLKARNSLIWIKTDEEARAEQYVIEAAIAAKFVPRTWDAGQGTADLNGKTNRSIASPDPTSILPAILDRAEQGADRGLWILRDFPVWLSGPMFATNLRILRNLARTLPGITPDKAQAIVIISPSAEVPPELRSHATVIEWPLPDRAEIGAILDVLAETYKLDLNGSRETAIDAAVGLSGEEAQAYYAQSIVTLKRIDPALVAAEKKRVISREGLLEWYDPLPDGLNSVGGLDSLKAWLVARGAAYTPQAREYGLPMPKGVFLVGVSGCGKSLTAKAIATNWQVPLLRVDLGALKSKFVGESEGKLRKVFATINSVGRAVVWFDEIEKALQGATSGSADGGVSADALGAILTWMQERSGEAFVIATANDISALPPEFLRKGRFDEIFFVDLPNAEERKAVIAAALKTHGRTFDTVFKPKTAELGEFVRATDKFTGAEIAALVPDALFTSFNDGVRPLLARDLVDAAERVVPLSKTANEKVEAIRKLVKEGRARPATSPLVEKAITAPLLDVS